LTPHLYRVKNKQKAESKKPSTRPAGIIDIPWGRKPGALVNHPLDTVLKSL